jgi:hypothetical protein
MEETNGPGINVLNLWSLAVTVHTEWFNITKIHLLSTQCISMFCVDLRTHSAYFPTQHSVIVFVSEIECVYCAVRTGFKWIAFRI